MDIIGNPDRVFPIFAGVWLVLGGASFYVFVFSANVERKKKIFKPFLVATGSLFLGFMWAMGFPPSVLAIAAPMVILVMYLNSRMTRFCGQCGKMIIQQMPSSPPRYCSYCGARL